ncbi:hypothetical protein [Roseateles sp. P5_E4]
MNDQLSTPMSFDLLTPREAAQWLLEAATRAAIQTGGATGLRPVRIDGRQMFRRDEVEGFAQVTLAA